VENRVGDDTKGISIKKITSETMDKYIKPLIIDEPGIIDVDEDDFMKLSSFNGEHYFIQNQNQNAFDATIDLFINFLKEKNLKTAKGMIAHIKGGSDFTFEHLEFYTSQIHKRVNHETEIIIGVTLDHNFKGFQLTLCAFGL
jgi:cell division GTPase FtsZ